MNNIGKSRREPGEAERHRRDGGSPPDDGAFRRQPRLSAEFRRERGIKPAYFNSSF